MGVARSRCGVLVGGSGGPWHCVEGCGGDDSGGGNAMLVMAVVVMRGGMPWRVVVMSGW